MTTATLHDVLSVDLHFHPGACSVRLSGELDRLSCPQLAAGVDRALSACGVVVLVVVDLRHVSFCDLDGLRTLEAARTRAPNGRGCGSGARAPHRCCAASRPSSASRSC